MNCFEVNQSKKNLLRKVKDKIKGFDFINWIREIKSLLNPGGSILFMPAVNRQKEQIIDKNYPIKTYYYVEDVENWDKSFYSSVLKNEGFEMIKNIPNYNHEKAFPTAFFYSDKRNK